MFNPFSIPEIEAFAYAPVFLLFLLIPLIVYLLFHFPKLFSPSFRYPTSHVAAAAKIDASPASDASFAKLLKHRLSARFIIRQLSLLSTALAAFLLITALARPYGTAIYENLAEGIDIYIVLDMSGSMRAYDLTQGEIQDLLDRNAPVRNRFEIATKELYEFVKTRQKQCHEPQSAPRCDRVGMVSFAKNAFLEFPLTTDYHRILTILAQRRLGDIDGSESCIGDAIARAVAGLRHSSAKSKVIVLFSDGAQRGGRSSIAQAVEAAKLYDVSIYPILVGSTEQALINTGSPERWALKKVDFPANWPALEFIAQSTHAAAFKAKDQAALKQQLHQILNAYETAPQNDSWDVNHADLSLYFVFWAFVCLCFSFILCFAFVKPYP
ncbi:MAG: VWA domain-containing protein [Bradymonadales bacterium]|jgi:Ca-activated chloride channel family protein